MNLVIFKVMRLSRSRYGMVQSVTEERRRCSDAELDAVIMQFRTRFCVVEVRVIKDGRP